MAFVSDRDPNRVLRNCGCAAIAWAAFSAALSIVSQLGYGRLLWQMSPMISFAILVCVIAGTVWMAFALAILASRTTQRRVWLLARIAWIGCAVFAIMQIAFFLIVLQSKYKFPYLPSSIVVPWEIANLIEPAILSIATPVFIAIFDARKSSALALAMCLAVCASWVHYFVSSANLASIRSRDFGTAESLLMWNFATAYFRQAAVLMLGIVLYSRSHSFAFYSSPSLLCWCCGYTKSGSDGALCPECGYHWNAGATAGWHRSP